MLPPAQMRQLFDAVKEAGSTSVVWTEFPTGNHMESFDTCRAHYWPAVQSFVKNLFTAASGALTLLRQWYPGAHAMRCNVECHFANSQLTWDVHRQASSSSCQRQRFRGGCRRLTQCIDKRL